MLHRGKVNLVYPEFFGQFKNSCNFVNVCTGCNNAKSNGDFWGLLPQVFDILGYYREIASVAKCLKGFSTRTVKTYTYFREVLQKGNVFPD